MLNHVDDEKLGQPRRARLAELMDYIRNHHNEWFTGYAISHPVTCGDFPGCMNGLQPFMVGLSMQALIYYHDLTGDQTVLPMMRRACDWLWTNAWRPNAGGFYYDSALGTGNGNAEPGLNLLIAPGYAWMYKMTGETTYRDRGDTIFGEGVRRTHELSVLGQEGSKGAYLWDGKQFNQQYMWSFEYLKWRGGSSDKNLSPSPPRTLRIS